MSLGVRGRKAKRSDGGKKERASEGMGILILIIGSDSGAVEGLIPFAVGFRFQAMRHHLGRIVGWCRRTTRDRPISSVTSCGGKAEY